MKNRGFKLHLLRHGMTELGDCYLGRTDAKLTDKGYHQMFAAVDQTTWDYAKVYSSPLGRCSVFATDHWSNKSLILDQRIAEYDFGDWEGLTASEIFAKDPQGLEAFWRNPEENPPPQAECLSHFLSRVSDFMDELHAEQTEHILLITHGGVMRAILALHQTKSFQSLLTTSIKHGELIELSWVKDSCS